MGIVVFPDLRVVPVANAIAFALVCRDDLLKLALDLDLSHPL